MRKYIRHITPHPLHMHRLLKGAVFESTCMVSVQVQLQAGDHYLEIKFKDIGKANWFRLKIDIIAKQKKKK